MKRRKKKRQSTYAQNIMGVVGSGIGLGAGAYVVEAMPSAYSGTIAKSFGTSAKFLPVMTTAYSAKEVINVLGKLPKQKKQKKKRK